MKIVRIIIRISISALLVFSMFTFYEEDFNFNFYTYNTTIDYDANSKYALVLNRETKKRKYQKDANTKAYPASLTKIMTAIVAIEQIDDLSEIVSIDPESYYKMLRNSSSMAGFEVSEKVTYNDLLYGTILSSGGEAANSLAVHTAGSVDDFVKLMNKKVNDLHLKGTNFTNPEGLDNPKQYTTANDMVVLLDYALNNSIFKDVFTKISYQTSVNVTHPDGIMLESTVLKTLEDSYKESLSKKDFNITGGKSGSTFAAGRNWAILGIKNDVEYIAVVMGNFASASGVYNDDHVVDTINIFELINESND